MLPDLAKVVLWSAIAGGENPRVLVVCADRWDATQAREELVGDHLRGKDEEGLWDLKISGADVRFYFPRMVSKWGVAKLNFTHVVALTKLISDESDGGALHRIISNPDMVVVRC